MCPARQTDSDAAIFYVGAQEVMLFLRILELIFRCGFVDSAQRLLLPREWAYNGGLQDSYSDSLGVMTRSVLHNVATQWMLNVALGDLAVSYPRIMYLSLLVL